MIGINKIIKTAIGVFICLNIIAAFHAYKFTHFSSNGIKLEKIRLNPLEKMKLLFLGVDIPKPVNIKLPNHPFQTVKINSNVKIEAWLIPAEIQQIGTVILFHGYTANKSDLIIRAENFHNNGYNCLLVDFMGSGGSDGNQTTIGFKEAEEVKDCFNFIKENGEQHIFLLGSSLGAAAIMKALNDYTFAPKAVILECPFGTMYQTVVARFNMLQVPPVPMAGILLFWGGVENGFWGFSHNPVDYAKNIHVPVLLQWGLHDDRVSQQETQDIYKNLHEPKKMIIYSNSGHDNYLDSSRVEWEKNTLDFIKTYSN